MDLLDLSRTENSPEEGYGGGKEPVVPWKYSQLDFINKKGVTGHHWFRTGILRLCGGVGGPSSLTPKQCES